MPQPKSPGIDWNEEAWIVLSIISKMPAHPPGGIEMPEAERQALIKAAEKNALMRYSADQLKAPREWPEDPLLSAGIRQVIERISLHVSYRAHKHYGFREKNSDGHPMMLCPISDDPTKTIQQRALFSSEVGAPIAPPDEMAFTAAIRLGVILRDRWIGREWRETLPLIVASIAGTSSANAKKMKPGAGRQPRKSGLAIAKEEARRWNPRLTNKELLRHLEGDGIVLAWTDKSVTWRDPMTDKERTTAMSTFLNY